MIQVQTNRPVYSNAVGDTKLGKKGIPTAPSSSSGLAKSNMPTATKETLKDKVKGFLKEDSQGKSRKENRKIRRTKRRAKRNAKKLERKKTPFGEKFTLALSKLTKKGSKSEKKNPDGTNSEVPQKDIVTTPKGSFDKVEVAKATGVTPEQVTPQFIEKNSVTTPSGEVSIIVPDKLVGQDDGGNPYLAEDLQDANEPQKDVVKEDDKKRGMSKTAKILLFSGIGVAVLVVGVILYRKFSNKGK